MRSTQRIVWLTCASIGLLAVPRAQALSAKEVYAKAADQIVTVECWNGNYIKTKQGSGILLGRISDKYGVDILTNYHVINGSSLIRITTKKGETFNASILYFDAPTDTALIRVGTSRFQSANPRIARDISVGDVVYAVGAPKGLGWTITSGIISGIRGDQSVKLVQTNASISSGSSGGGLFNDLAELIGMTSFYLKEAQNLNFAVAVSEEFLSSVKRFREQEAPITAFTQFMPEDFWFIGHYEPRDDLAKSSNPALKRWSIYDEKWKTLSREQLDTSFDSKAYKEFDVKISKLLAERYADFPNDRVGFLAHLDFVNDRRTKINELLAAAEKWPGEFDMIYALYSTLKEDERLPVSVILKPVAAFVDALPSISEVEKLTGHKLHPGRYRVQLVVQGIGPILYLLDHTSRGIREGETTAQIRATLEEKGWNVKREVSGH
jgi:hypothetical protein